MQAVAVDFSARVNGSVVVKSSIGTDTQQASQSAGNEC